MSKKRKNANGPAYILSVDLKPRPGLFHRQPLPQIAGKKPVFRNFLTGFAFLSLEGHFPRLDYLAR